jgi:hypothetical protein
VISEGTEETWSPFLEVEMKDITAEILAIEIGMKDSPPFDVSSCDFGFFISEVASGICGRMIGGTGLPVELLDYYSTNIQEMINAESSL